MGLEIIRREGLSSAGFSLRGLILARPNSQAPPRRLKLALLAETP